MKNYKIFGAALALCVMSTDVMSRNGYIAPSAPVAPIPSSIQTAVVPSAVVPSRAAQSQLPESPQPRIVDANQSSVTTHANTANTVRIIGQNTPTASNVASVAQNSSVPMVGGGRNTTATPPATQAPRGGVHITSSLMQAPGGVYINGKRIDNGSGRVYIDSFHSN